MYFQSAEIFSMSLILKKLCSGYFHKAQNEENKILLFRDTHISGKNKQRRGSDDHRNQSTCYLVGQRNGGLGRVLGGVSRGSAVFS